jgi:hypothetical protein
MSLALAGNSALIPGLHTRIPGIARIKLWQKKRGKRGEGARSLLMYPQRKGALSNVAGWALCYKPVACSIPDELSGFSNWPNPSSCSITQPQTEMSTSNMPGRDTVRPTCKSSWWWPVKAETCSGRGIKYNKRLEQLLRKTVFLITLITSLPSVRRLSRKCGSLDVSKTLRASAGAASFS